MTKIKVKAAGHPSPSSTVYSEQQWQEFLSHPLCAEEMCLSAQEATGDEDITSMPHSWTGKKIRGRVWKNNGTMDGAFPPAYEKYCFTCAFWHYQADKDKDPSAPNRGIVIRGSNPVCMVHYCFAKEQPYSHDRATMRGFGGRTFNIRFLDGNDTPIVTNNLWYQGDIPRWLEYLFMINAEFAEE